MLVFAPGSGALHSAIMMTMKKSGLFTSSQTVLLPKTSLMKDIDILGTQGVIDAIIDTVGTTNPVYLSVDIDVLDPGICPGTGTPESGGWTTRELRQILRGLYPLRIVGGDLVEVSPPYDDAAQTTALAASDLIFEMISIMVKNPGFKGPSVDISPRRRSKFLNDGRTSQQEMSRWDQT